MSRLVSSRSPPSAPQWESVVALAAGALCVVGVVTEWASSGLRQVWVDHPLLTGLVSGGLVLAPLIIALERALQRREDARVRAFEQAAAAQAEALELRETERWKRPAWDAIQTYAYIARLTSDAFNERFQSTAERLGIDPYHDRFEVLKALAREHPKVFENFFDAERDAVARTGAIAIGTASTLALYPPYRDLLPLVSDVQRSQRRLIEVCIEIYFLYMRSDRVEEANRKAGELGQWAFAREAHISRIESALNDPTRDPGPI